MKSKLVPRLPRRSRKSSLSAARDPQAIYGLQADICRALGHPKRIHIVELLGQGEKGANQLRQALDVSKVNLSQHLALLRGAGLVRAHKTGREVSYSLALPELRDACHFIRQVLTARLEQGLQLAEQLQSEPSPVRLPVRQA